ncbi:MAG: hypothetical protein ACI9OJ_003352, partial [Myxococcota bacterium]
MRKTNMKRLGTRSIACLAAVGFMSCTGGAPGPVTSGLDESVACPDGTVGWRFAATGAPATNNTFEVASQESSAAGATFEAAVHVAVDVQSATCGSLDVTAEARTCAGRTSCTFSSSRCTTVLSLTYNCGPGDADPETNSLREYTVTGGAGEAVDLGCTAPVVTNPLPTTTACVPRICHGATRRDALMACVPDATMPTASVELGSFDFNPVVAPGIPAQCPADNSSTFIDALGRREQPCRVGLNQPIWEEAYYEWDAWVGFDATPPADTRLTMWFADVYSVGGASYAKPVDTHLEYRCVATHFDMQDGIAAADIATALPRAPGIAQATRSGLESSTQQLFFRHRSQLPRDCYVNADTRFPEEIVRDGVTLRRSTTTVFFSYDIDGRTVLLRDLVDQAGKVVRSESMAQACAPNPPGFYYQANEGFDRTGYYLQRALNRPSERTSYGYGHFFRPSLNTVVDAQALTLAESTVTVSNSPLRGTDLAVDVDYTVTNGHPRNPLSPNYQGTDGRFPSDLRAQVYIFPWLKDDRHRGTLMRGTTALAIPSSIPTMGSIALGEGSPEGVTASGTLSIPASVRSQFFNPASELYIPPSAAAGLFAVFACVESNALPDSRWFQSGSYRTAPSNTVRGSDNSVSGLVEVVAGTDRFRLGAGSFPRRGNNPWGVLQNSGLACIFADAPLRVIPDRLQRAVEPLGNVAFQGAPNATSSGGGSMSGKSDNDLAIACSDDEGRICRETSRNALGSIGELGQSFFNVTMDLSRNEGVNISGDFTAEALGLQVLDGPAIVVPWSNSSEPVTLTVAPAWEPIRDALNGATGGGLGNAPEWNTGNYGGMMGLGLGIGRKIPFKIGPIPGLLIISSSVGVSLEFVSTFQFA